MLRQGASGQRRKNNAFFVCTQNLCNNRGTLLRVGQESDMHLRTAGIRPLSTPAPNGCSAYSSITQLHEQCRTALDPVTLRPSRWYNNRANKVARVSRRREHSTPGNTNRHQHMKKHCSVSTLACTRRDIRFTWQLCCIGEQRSSRPTPATK